MLALLERSSVFIHLDPRKDEVRVPPWFKKQPQLVLQVGLNMAVRIPDLDVGDEAVSCTLSFNRSPVFCYMPWSSVFALVADDGKGMIWPSDIPKEVAAQQAEQADKDQNRAQIRAVPPPATTASVTPATKAAKPSKAKDDPAKPSAKKRGPARLRAEKAPSAEGRPPTPPLTRAPKAPSGPNAIEPQGRAAPASRPGSDGKRQLPSYLRVVK
jgi:stringent starvation protein B